jgi:hypothetical protein
MANGNGNGDHGNGEQLPPHYVRDLVVVRVDDALGDGRTRLERAASLVGGEIVEEGNPIEGIHLDTEAVQRLGRVAGLLKVDDAGGTLGPLREEGFEAGRIAGLHFMSHYISGETKPTPALTRPELDIEDVEPEKLVAIVDTGVASEDSLPVWMRKSVIAQPEDRENVTGDSVSHGTFVASLIRQVAQNHGVSVAKAGVSDDTIFEDQETFDDQLVRLAMTTEAHVSDGILRLIDRHRHGEVDALNISLGGDFVGNEMVLLRAALQAWNEAHPEAPIVSAAGNSERNQPVYPAAAPEVQHSVAAANSNGEEIVWEDRNDDAQPAEVVWAVNNPSNRTWVNALAPGSELWGASGRAEDDFVCWSGSSFASALVAAAVVENRPATPDAGGRDQWFAHDVEVAISGHCESPAEAAD